MANAWSARNASEALRACEQMLRGRVAGVEVLDLPGGGISVRIRGATSVLGTNQPLFVVDGQPIDNQTVSSQQGPTDFPGSGGTVTQNRAADINKIPVARKALARVLAFEVTIDKAGVVAVRNKTDFLRL